MIAVADLKRTHRATWAAGDYAAVAELIDEVPPRDLLARVDIAPGPRRARRRHRHRQRRDPGGRRGRAGRRPRPHAGAVRHRPPPRRASTASRSTGSRATPRSCRSTTRASTACCRCSASSSRRATRSSRAGARARLRPGGRIGLVNWTPEGLIGELFKIIGSYLPAPPDYASPPPLWGNEEHVRALFADTGVELEFARGHNPWRFDSAEHFVVVHGDPLRPDAEGARAARPPRDAGRSAATRSSRWPSAATRRPTAAC